MRFFRPRTIYWPTRWGWLLAALIVAAPVLLWWFKAESFLGRTERRPASVLVVEGWIGVTGVSAAKAEFRRGGYDYIVTTSGLSGESWSARRWNFAREAEKQLLGSGLKREVVMSAVPRDDESHRTFESAAAVWRTLHDRKIQPSAINVFTRGVHARRSRVVFAKVFEPLTEVGVIAWEPTETGAVPWWRSSRRANDLLKESVGYLFELLFNSGRSSNTAEEQESDKTEVAR